MLVFLLNGGTSIASKTHQISTDAIGTNDFIIWVRIIKALLLFLALIVCVIFGLVKKKKEVCDNNIKVKTKSI